MKYIEFTGEQLSAILMPDELNEDQLKASGVEPQTVCRVNEQGDLEIRRRDGWYVIGGLLGDFRLRVERVTALEWAAAESGE